MTLLREDMEVAEQLKRSDTDDNLSQASQSFLGGIPKTSGERLDRAHPKLHHHPTDHHTVLDHHDISPNIGESTILYLAFGSNMCAETFLGVRGIKPLSQLNVSAPSLTLTFDIPGLPYREPCFANTAPRILKAPHPDSNLSNMPPVPLPSLPPELVGVVYEVTTSDYAKIIATEGGGTSYQQIMVPCFELPPSIKVPEKPIIPEPPRPFLARTLMKPRIPDDLGEYNGDASNDRGRTEKQDDKKRNKWKWLVPVQRNQDYAQPSLRYLTLLRTGAVEHDLPQYYRDHLNSLQHYEITSTRQKLGRFLFSIMWAPLYLVFFSIAKIQADETGRVPAWMSTTITILFNAVWVSYDLIFKQVFGDGERTEEKEQSLENLCNSSREQNEKARARKSPRRSSKVTKAVRRMSGSSKIVDEEKRPIKRLCSSSESE